MQRAAPKKIENEYWNMPGDGGHSYYRVSRTDNGRVEVSRRRGANKTSAYVRTALLDELQKALNPYAVDAWHGFSMPGNGPNDPLRMEFSLKYDTLQNVYARSVMGQEGDVPEGMEELSAKLSALCDRTLDACGGPLPKRADALKSFSFGERGMRMGSWPGYEIYQRMETDGPVMVLERELGLEKTECLISDAELQDFERLLKKTGIIGWNGFSGSNRNVLDGTSFRLHAGFWDGRNIRAEGYMRFPKGYRDAMEQVYAHLNAVLAKKSMQHD